MQPHRRNQPARLPRTASAAPHFMMPWSATSQRPEFSEKRDTLSPFASPSLCSPEAKLGDVGGQLAPAALLRGRVVRVHGRRRVAILLR